MSDFNKIPLEKLTFRDALEEVRKQKEKSELPAPQVVATAGDAPWTITRREWFVSIVYQGMLANNRSSAKEAIALADELISALDQYPNKDSATPVR